jgi:hypothetical protein
LLELLGVRMCASSGLSGDDDKIQRITHHILFKSIFPQLETLTRPLSPRNTTSSNSQQRKYFSPNIDLYEGSSVLSSTSDPYLLYAQSLVRHDRVQLTSSETLKICESVQDSHLCAASSVSRIDPALKPYLRQKVGGEIVWGFKGEMFLMLLIFQYLTN